MAGRPLYSVCWDAMKLHFALAAVLCCAVVCSAFEFPFTKPTNQGPERAARIPLAVRGLTLLCVGEGPC